MPLPMCLAILLCGLLLLWFTRKQRIGKVIVTAGVIILTGLSYGIISDSLLRGFEDQYSPFLIAENAKWVVVLGGGHTSDPDLPVTSQPSSGALVRLIEGIRIQRLLPSSKLVLSGGKGFDPRPHAELLADIAMAIGMDKRDLVLEAESKDTKDEAIFIRKIVGDAPFVIVTFASHMPRAMALFRKQGMHPIPAPTDYWVKKRQKVHPSMFFPNPDNLCKAHRAVYELLGVAWAKLRGQI